MSGYHFISPKAYKSAYIMDLIDRKCKMFKKKNKLQSDVKVGMWKYSRTN